MSIMMVTTPADNLAPLADGRFSYGPTSGFRFGHVARMSLAELQKLFKTKRSRGYKLTKKDAEAQLRLYGVPCSRSMLVGEMRDMLGKMVKEGKLSAPTAEEVSLREKYDALNEAHLASLSRTRQATFESITDPGEAAAFSVPLFLQRYFLNADGTPNRTKTPDPIALPGNFDFAEMHSAAEKIPGLHLCNDEGYCASAIGWDCSAVHRVAEEAAAVVYQKYAEERSKLGRAEAEVDTWWMGGHNEDEDEEVGEDKQRTIRMDKHQRFLETLKDDNKGTKETANKDFDISHVTGRYLVECRDIEEQWGPYDGLYMTIVPDKENMGRTVAEFDFGMLEGIMRFRQVGEEPLPDGDDVDSEEEVCSEEEEGDDMVYSFSPWTVGKRKRSTAKSQLERHQPQAKKQKPLPIPTGTEKFKLLFMWRGRETGEGEIELDYNGLNKGYIEFENPDCTTFTGIMDSTFFQNAELRGYKVARSDGKKIEAAWRDFSERAYQRASISRWH